jgi:transcriptional regulator with XRE-family HTH domain
VSAYRLHIPELCLQVNAKRRAQGRTWAQLARHLEISPSTMSKLAGGRPPSVDTFLTLLAYLDRDQELTDLMQPGGEQP